MRKTNLSALRRAVGMLLAAVLAWLTVWLWSSYTAPVTGGASPDVAPQAVVSITPSALVATVVAGGVTTQTFNIHNRGVITLTFEISESPVIRPPQPTTEPGPAWGRQAPGSPAPPGNARIPGAGWAPQRYTTGQVATGTPRILLYTDDFFTGPGSTYAEQALQALGLPFTAYYADPNGFLGALRAEAPWDLVLVSHNERLAGGALWPDVEAYLAAGGRVIVETFDIDGSHSLPTSLWTMCDVMPAGDLFDAPPVLAWVPGHSVFTEPVPAPLPAEFQDLYLDDGDRLRVLDGAPALAGFTPQPTPGQAAIVLGAEGRCLVNSFIISTNAEDRDADGLLDGVALWVNEISLIARDFIEVPWIRVEPTRGSLGPGAIADIAVTLNADVLQPGSYQARLILRTDGDPLAIGVPVNVAVNRAPDMGRITGLVLDAATGEILHARVHAFGTPYTVETSPRTGWYNLWLRAGTYTLEASAEGHYPARQVVEIAAGDVRSYGFLLRRRGVYVLPILRNWP